jgi:hypothetical protein
MQKEETKEHGESGRERERERRRQRDKDRAIDRKSKTLRPHSFGSSKRIGCFALNSDVLYLISWQAALKVLRRYTCWQFTADCPSWEAWEGLFWDLNDIR